jgi:GNAT superfamily N-acetyltransferase
MKFVSSLDPEIELYRESFRNQIQQCEARGFSYWIGVEGIDPVGFLLVGKEPIRLIAPIGVTVAIVSAVRTGKSPDVYLDFASRSIEIAQENGAEHLFTNLNHSKYEDAITQFQKAGFDAFVRSFHMQTQIDDAIAYSGDLRFERVKREDMDHFAQLLMEFMQGASDPMLRIISGNIVKLPESMLDMWYESEEFYIAYKDDEAAAILDISPKSQDNISNIGVAPSFRGLGFGRQVMLFAIQALKGHGVEQAQVRVSATNQSAISLYESLGFKQNQQDTALIWWKHGAPEVSS